MKKIGDDPYELMWGDRYGFAKLAIQHQAIVIPLASVGTADMFAPWFDIPFDWMYAPHKVLKRTIPVEESHPSLPRDSSSSRLSYGKDAAFPTVTITRRSSTYVIPEDLHDMGLNLPSSYHPERLYTRRSRFSQDGSRKENSPFTDVPPLEQGDTGKDEKEGEGGVAPALPTTSASAISTTSSLSLPPSLREISLSVKVPGDEKRVQNATMASSSIVSRNVTHLGKNEDENEEKGQPSAPSHALLGKSLPETQFDLASPPMTVNARDCFSPYQEDSYGQPNFLPKLSGEAKVVDEREKAKREMKNENTESAIFPYPADMSGFHPIVSASSLSTTLSSASGFANTSKRREEKLSRPRRTPLSSHPESHRDSEEKSANYATSTATSSSSFSKENGDNASNSNSTTIIRHVPGTKSSFSTTTHADGSVTRNVMVGRKKYTVDYPVNENVNPDPRVSMPFPQIPFIKSRMQRFYIKLGAPIDTAPWMGKHDSETACLQVRDIVKAALEDEIRKTRQYQSHDPNRYFQDRVMSKFKNMLK